MKSFSITDVGMKRKVNQDYVYSQENAVGSLPNLFIVADGMGGHNAGDYASRFCVESVIHTIVNGNQKTPIGIIEAAITNANKLLIEEAKKSSDLEGMGTTFVLATIMEDVLYVANIGDSRLYIVNDTIKQITEDHSLVEEMVKTGEIERKDARLHPNKNIITRALGANQLVVPDFFEVNITEDDTILMCSDGLSNMMDDDDILRIMKEYPDDIEKAASKLIEAANEYGGNDNIAIIIVRP
ncbi:Stp1/IreP family PP2C-type Ser/Thr phosphatase [Anaeromicropila herbilytica]|uniref:Protein phosphatase n=1 Tax=Anaeromicropila herbilytica TaxID=2785025 RepID=A0A7R7EMJ4_9FIRM|nr:Stp1/IreP family PP2C-type Ser/Thr phosphatase [Anaeromicropila herbilytica]BCN31569.1 protein phosphatase [Anaeromicropila herbilytica]